MSKHMSKPMQILGIVGVLCAAFLIAFQVSAQNGLTETLSIAFIGATEGKPAATSQQFYQAAVLAAEQINAGEDDDVAGVRASDGTRYSLEIVFYEANTTDEALDAYDQAVDEGVIAVLDPNDKDLSAALLDRGSIDAAVISGQPDAADGGTTSAKVFRATADYDDWVNAAADYLVEERQFTRVGIITSDSEIALDARDTFKAAVDDDVIAVEFAHTPEDEDFTEDARELQDSDAEALFVWTTDAQMLALMDALQAAGWDGVIVYSGLDGDFLNTAGERAADFIGMTGWTASAYDADSEAFVSDYQARWETLPVDNTAAYYDAVWMIAEAVTESGISTSSIANRLSNATDFAGVQGEYDRTETDTVLLVQAQPDGQRIEAARYVGGACVTCPDLWRADTSDDTVTQTETFNIGLLTTTSGGSEATGESIEQAVRLAIREINETGGIVRSSTRYTLNLTVYDTTSDASAAFQEAVDDGMQIILGPDYNGQILPNLTDAANADLVQLVSATSDQIAVNQSDDLVFQLRPTDETMVNTAAAYLLDVREIERFAFVAVRTDYGLDAADSFGDAVADGDGTLALRLEHDLEQTDFTELAQQIVDANVGAVGVWTTQPAAAALLTALESLNWDGVFMYGYLTPDYAAQFEASTVEVAGAVNWWSDAGDWASRDFAGRYAARYGAAPAPQSASYYDAVYLLAEAIATNGATSANLQNWLTNLTAFIGIQGEYRPADYDTGELTQYVYIVGSEAGDDGVLQTLARYDGTTCLNGCE